MVILGRQAGSRVGRWATRWAKGLANEQIGGGVNIWVMG